MYGICFTDNLMQLEFGWMGWQNRSIGWSNNWLTKVGVFINMLCLVDIVTD